MIGIMSESYDSIHNKISEKILNNSKKLEELVQKIEKVSQNFFKTIIISFSKEDKINMIKNKVTNHDLDLIERLKNDI